MKKITYLLSALALSAAPVISSAQSQFSLQSQTLTNSDNEPGPVFPLPTERQLKWNETEFYAFFHYGMNTYTNLEWGNGDEAESIFAPTAAPNPEQWLKAVQAAGMKGGIAVVKHHDGFCLWPTSSTTHSVVKAGNAFGRETNIPRDFAAAAQKLGLKYGFYVSPWDRNSALYGTDKYVKDVFLRQCAELATYGTDQFEMWFDGANGGDGYYGGRKTTISVDRETYYDIPNLRDSIHKVCPNIILWGVGGEARWIGNEAGWAGETNWATENLGYAPERNGMYGTEDGWIWFPGESDAKMTDQGWFWHSNESPLSAERLFQMYLETVGRNATLILNCPPNKAGVLPEADVRVLKQLGTMLKNRLGNDLAKNAHIEVSNTRTAGAHRNYETANLTDGDAKTYWATNDGVNNATITLTWDTPQTVRYVMLQEYIRLGQRIKSFKIETSTDGTTWKAAAPGVTTTTVGYKRIIPLNGSTANSYGNGTSVKAVRITLTDSKSCPTLSTLSVF
jgi:F5/8 type C domain protein|nr:alpha-L-fucosidase [uncultured Alloprevotella sp.]